MMKKIFKKINILSAVALLLCATSCEDFLETPSLNSYASDNVYTNVSRAEMATLGCYTGMRSNEIYTYLNYGTDEAMSSEGVGGSKQVFSSYNLTPALAPGYINTLYTQIAKTNNCIKNIPVMDAYNNGNATDKKALRRYYGEVLTLRAIYYSDLIRYWGDVPFITLPGEDYASLYSSRVSRDVIYDAIIADLQTAVELIPWQSELGTSSERLSKQAVKGFLARTALYAAGYSLRWDLKTYDPSTLKMAKRDDPARVREFYQIASDATADIINQKENALNASYEKVFRNYALKVQDTKENLFEVGFAETGHNNRVGYINGNYIETGNETFGKTVPNGWVVPTFYLSFADGDTRRDVSVSNFYIKAPTKKDASITDDMVPSKLDDLRFGKWRLNWKKDKYISATQTSINWVMLRYSDVLLMYAEAQNELNGKPTDGAIKALKDVRTRAFGGDTSKIGTIPADYEGFLNAIVKERAWELAFEGYRRTDLIRWNKLGDVLAQTKASLLDLVDRKGAYADIEEARDYKLHTKALLNDPKVALDYIPVKKADLGTQPAAGYVRLTAFNPLVSTSRIVTEFASGYRANYVELCPFTTNIMDTNLGLKGQQLPGY